MKYNPINMSNSMRTVLIIFTVLFHTSCDSLLDADLDKSLITEDKIFSNDVTATSAVTGMYNSMVNYGSFSGKPDGIASLASLSAGELSNYPQSANYVEFEEHQILETNPIIESIWNNTYNIIYQANAIIEGIRDTKSISEKTASQLEGEARFTRAFCYFYLTNLFQDVPVLTSTDYIINKTLPRSSTDEVYELILSDLNAAQSLLLEDYITNERLRPNKKTATALLARVYLYRKNFINAELTASIVIEDGSYVLIPEIENIFLKESKETIWQLANVNQSYCTLEGYYFILTSTPTDHILSKLFIKELQPNDKRTQNWIGQYYEYYDTHIDTLFFPHKYKVKQKEIEDPAPEYSVVIRLAEMYLIRAEARVLQGNLTGAEEDLNEIRKRAGLNEIHGSNTETLLQEIAKERKIELFSEWGHLWFDLRRTDKAIENIENNITIDDLLYPIPKSEFTRNPNLGDQNNGY